MSELDRTSTEVTEGKEEEQNALSKAKPRPKHKLDGTIEQLIKQVAKGRGNRHPMKRCPIALDLAFIFFDSGDAWAAPIAGVSWRSTLDMYESIENIVPRLIL